MAIYKSTVNERLPPPPFHGCFATWQASKSLHWFCHSHLRCWNGHGFLSCQEEELPVSWWGTTKGDKQGNEQNCLSSLLSIAIKGSWASPCNKMPQPRKAFVQHVFLAHARTGSWDLNFFHISLNVERKEVPFMWMGIIYAGNSLLNGIILCKHMGRGRGGIFCKHALWKAVAAQTPTYFYFPFSILDTHRLSLPF